MKPSELQDLRAHVRIERMELVAELRPLQVRVAEIHDRLAELDKADALLEND
jgi:hypothetical protein